MSRLYMPYPQIAISIILTTSLALFIYGRWRYDIVAILALMSATLTGLIPPSEAFLGFGHPAVITVIAVFALSTGLQNAGVVNFLYALLSKISRGFWSQLLLLSVGIAAISGFMNNIGALALLLPITIRVARENKKPPSQFLMPIAFSSLLGGMITMIGTPPNIIVALLREKAVGSPFGMFDFTPVGLGVAIAGIAFMTLIGWRLIPSRKGEIPEEELLDIKNYFAELLVGKESSCKGMLIREFEAKGKGEASVIALLRRKKQITAPSINEEIRSGDILIVESDPVTLQELIETFTLSLKEEAKIDQKLLEADDMMIAEVVVKQGAPITRAKIENMRLKARFGLHLLAISRSGRRIEKPLSQVKVQAGDVLLLRGMQPSLYEDLGTLGCLPLQSRGLAIGNSRRLFLSLSIFGTAIFMASLGYFPIQIAFALAVVTMYFFGLLKLGDIYQSVDWPIVVLLGAFIPVGNALETTGAAALLAEGILRVAGGQHPAVILTITLVGTMFLSDLVNNATAAILMVPIAIGLATGLHASPDPFLMAVAIGASCPFLTPIGHQCNTLILGPGGYYFSDYWRVGLPLEAVIVAVAIPLLLLFWPL